MVTTNREKIRDQRKTRVVERKIKKNREKEISPYEFIKFSKLEVRSSFYVGSEGLSLFSLIFMIDDLLINLC